jgi:tRNA(fMet)-specific endonuclease VapC
MVVDTSVVVAAFRFDAEVVDRLSSVYMLVSTTVLGELYYGAYGASQQGVQLAKINDLITHSAVIGSTEDTARYYGQIKQALRLRGLLIPENDMWIAAVALEQDLPLATRDDHFERVPGLSVERW